MIERRRPATNASGRGYARGAVAYWLFALVLLLALAPLRSALAQSANPHSSGIMGIGPARSTGFSAASGSAIEALPIELAQGRKRFQPNLTLLYSSMGGMGEIGLGFGLDIGRIQRSPARGIPTGSNIDEFVFSLAGSGEILIPIGNGAYRPRFESAFRQYRLVGDHWEVRDAQGTLYVFGSSPATRVDGTLWMLERAEDPNGNTVTISYLQNGGYFYPAEIAYTGHAPSGDAGANRVVFEYEERPDQTISFALGIEQRRTQRLFRISNYASSALVRRYEFTYVQSSGTERSLVEAIELVGSDDSSRVRSRSYEYQVGAFAFDSTSLSNPFPINFRDDEGRDTGGRSMDVNGDGFVDVLDNGTRVWLGDGAGGFQLDAGWSASFAAAGVRFVDGDHLDEGTRLVDINGDLRPDLLVAPAGDASGKRVLLNTGLGWEHSALAESYEASLRALVERAVVDAEFLDPRCRDGGAGQDPGTGDPECDGEVPFDVAFSLVERDGDATGASLADVNADGLADLVWSFQTTTALVDFPTPPGGFFDGGTVTRIPVRIAAVYLNLGDRWVKSDSFTDSLFALPPFVIDTQLQAFDVLDVNGDGAGDVVNTAAATGSRGVWLSNGTSWQQNADYTDSIRASQIVSLADSKSQGLMPADFNHDGLLDYLRADEGVQIAYRNTGLGFAEDSAATAVLVDLGVRFADGDGVPSGFELSDVNGDSLADLTRNRAGSGNSIRFATGAIPDLLGLVRSGTGEETTLDYSPSTDFDHRDSSGIWQLPAVLNVVTTLTRSDGRGNSFPSTVTYEGGLFAQSDRIDESARFRSFAASGTLDSRGVLTVRRFAQTEPLAGAVTSNEVYDTGGNLRSRKTATYATPDAGDGVTQIRLLQTDDETIDPGGTLHTRLRYTYDEHLNVTELAKDGEVAVLGDEGRTVFTHAKNLSVGIVSLLARTSVFDAGGNLNSQSTLLYDDHTTLGQVSKGNVTEVVDLVQVGGAERTKRTEYDAFGNPLRVIDARGGVSSFVYDDTSTFSVATTDPLGRIGAAQFDPRFGTATQNVDPNGNVTTREFDAFGRVVKETFPGDECSPFGTRSLTYSPIGDPTAQSVRVRATETPGQPETFDSETFFDGFGQVYRAETEGAGGRTLVMLVEFDDAGNRSAASQPFFEGDAVSMNTVEFDALRRIVRQTDSRGAVMATIYRGAARDDIDPRGNVTTSVVNGYGKVTEVHQFVGGRELVTTNVYDVVGNRTRITNPGGELIRIEYDALGQKTALDDPALGSFSYEYDPNGNLIAQQGPTGTFVYEYNAANEIVGKQMPDGQEITFTYGTADDNAVGRIGRVEDSAGTLDIVYDARGNISQKRRTLGRDTFITAYSRDSLNRIRQITYPDGFRVDYTYNAGSLVAAIHDGNGVPIASDMQYNALGEITALHFANGVSSSYSFDAAGLMRTINTASAQGGTLQNLVMEYDAARNARAITDNRSVEASQSFDYDELNRLTRATGAYGEEQYRYDEVGNFIRKGHLVFARDAEHLQQVRCSIDLNLVELRSNGIDSDPRLRDCLETLLQPDSGLTAAERTTLSTISERASKRNDPASIGDSLALEYDDAGNLVERGDRRLEYDAESRLDNIHDHGKPIEENVYGADGQRVVREAGPKQTIFIDGLYEQERPAPGQGQVRRHVRLENAVLATIVTPLKDVNLISEAPSGLLNVCQSARVDLQGQFPELGGQLLQLRDRVENFACRIGLSPSAPGALVGVLAVLAALFMLRRSTTRVFGAALAIVRGVGYKLRRRPWFSGLSVFLIVGQLLQLAHPSVAHAASPNPDNNDRLQEQRFYYHLDHLGNTNVVSDARGVASERRDYRPFGEQLNRTGDETLEISFNGQQFDANAGFYYFGARHYDPLLGRFTTPDTQVSNDSPQTLHRYVFNNNNPLRFVDVTGHDALDILGDIFVALLVVAAIVVGVLIIVASGGAATPLVGLAIGVAGGALLGAGIAFGIGYVLYRTGAITFGEVLEITLAGAIIGAAIGGAIGVGLAGGFAAGASKASVIASQTAFGAATGSAGSATSALVNGATPSQFLESVFIGTAKGAISGAISGVFSAYAAGPLSKVMQHLGFPKSAVSAIAPGSRSVGGWIYAGTKGFGDGYLNASESQGFDDIGTRILRPVFDIHDAALVGGGVVLGGAVVIGCAATGFGGCIDAALTSAPLSP